MSSKHRPDIGLKELKEFILKLDFDASHLDHSDEIVRRVYKKFYLILLFDYLIQNSQSGVEAKNYARESVSDMSHGFLLSFLGLYKPALTCVRSSIENFLRFIVLNSGRNIKDLNTVYQLFDCVNSVYAQNENQKRRIGHLRGEYGLLCNTVHSSGIEYMNLIVPFEKMFKFEKDRFNGNVDFIYKCCNEMSRVYFIDLYNLVCSAHHGLKDQIFDGVSRGIKREAAENLLSAR